MVADNKKGVTRMRNYSKSVIFVLFLCCLMFFAKGALFAGQYAALEGVQSIKAVFDVRTGNPKSAAVYLKLIQETFADESIRGVSKSPQFAVVLMGPAVQLASKNRSNVSADESKALDEIAGLIAQMAKDGIKFEICLFAAKIFGVDTGSILPEIEQVHNGWISLIGYEAKGYALVPVY